MLNHFCSPPRMVVINKMINQIQKMWRKKTGIATVFEIVISIFFFAQNIEFGIDKRRCGNIRRVEKCKYIAEIVFALLDLMRPAHFAGKTNQKHKTRIDGFKSSTFNFLSLFLFGNLHSYNIGDSLVSM